MGFTTGLLQLSVLEANFNVGLCLLLRAGFLLPLPGCMKRRPQEER